MMEFKEILQKLKHSDRFNFSLIAKEIFTNIQYIHKTELLHILEILSSTSDMAFQVKLLSILSACLLYNNANRDIIIKWPLLYDILSTILARGLPMKTAVTLNFITSLLYNDDYSLSKSKTLTLYAQSMIRSSGCLTIMTHLFTNSMTYVDTWKALCHCIAEVCRGSEINQTYCSHLVPLCIHRCLQGNITVLPVLHNLLYNHKRNTELFLKTDGMVLFNSKEYLQNETCLQLLNTVVENTEVETLRIIIEEKKIFEHLQNMLKMQTPDSGVSQWATITLYYLETKTRKSHFLSNRSVGNENKRLNISMVTGVLDRDEKLNDTQVLMKNIMSEILSYPPEPKPRKQLYGVSDKLSKMNRISQRIVKETDSQFKGQKLDHEKRYPKSLYHEQLSFSFLLNENGKDKSLSIDNNSNFNEKTYKKCGSQKKESGYEKYCNNKCQNQTDIHDQYSYQSDLGVLLNRKYRKPSDVNKQNESKQPDSKQFYENTHDKEPNYTQLCDSRSRKEIENSQLYNSFTMLDSNNENVIEFKPAFVSTPIRQCPKKRSISLHKNSSSRRSFTEFKNKDRFRNCTNIKAGRKRLQTSEKVANKQKSISSRLLEVINESCTTFIKSVKNVFTGSTISTSQRKELTLTANTKTNINKEANSNEESYCSFSFTKYMQKREAELNKQNTKQSDESEISTFSNINKCQTCNDTFLLKQKLTQDDQLKVTVKKLKLGINLYGCDFKKISKALWPKETYMTPNVLYNLYRKLILK